MSLAARTVAAGGRIDWPPGNGPAVSVLRYGPCLFLTCSEVRPYRFHIDYRYPMPQKRPSVVRSHADYMPIIDMRRLICFSSVIDDGHVCFMSVIDMPNLLPVVSDFAQGGDIGRKLAFDQRQNARGTNGSTIGSPCFRPVHDHIREVVTHSRGDIGGNIRQTVLAYSLLEFSQLGSCVPCAFAGHNCPQTPQRATAPNPPGQSGKLKSNSTGIRIVIRRLVPSSWPLRNDQNMISRFGVSFGDKHR